MNNLKRVLSLALASVMVIGMMVTGASAFTDDADIENKEAVGTMTALNIIDGMPDGSFDPDGLLLREQAAKMVFVALNGGQKNDNLTTKEVGTFSDVKKGNWAEGYIEWCYNRGIIAGIGGGLFNPKGNLTGTQLAKIMLVAIGYNAKTEGLEGTNDWALNVNALALNKGFYKNLGGIDPEANITRDQAALLILNACNAEMVKYEYQITANNGQIATVATAVDIKSTDITGASHTILTESYDALNKDGLMVSYNYVKATKTFSYGIRENNTWGVADTTFTSDQDFTALIGQKVRVLYKKDSTTSNADNEVYGITDVTPALVTTTVGQTTAKVNTTTGLANVTAGGNTYNLTNNATVLTAVNVYEAKATPVTSTNLSNFKATYAEPSILKLMDWDGNGTIDGAFVTEVKVGQVSYVSSTAVNTNVGNFTVADDDIYTGATKGDFVTVIDKAYTYTGKNTVAKVEVLEGTVDRTRSNSTTGAYDIQIDGTWYVKGATLVGTSDTVTAGDSIKVAVVGGYYFNIKKVTTLVTDLLMVGDVGTLNLGKLDAVVYFTDGTSATVTVASVDTVANAAPTSAALYTYSVNSKGAYVLTSLATTTNQAGYTLYAADVTGADVDNADATADKLTTTASGNFRIADDAVVFYYNSSSGAKTAKVYTGKAVKAWDTDVANASSTQLLGDEVDGFKTAKVVVLNRADVAPGTAGDEKFGYVVSAKATLSVESGNKYYVNFQIWDGKQVLDVKQAGTSSSNTLANEFKQGHFITYKDLGNGVVSTATDLTYGTPITSGSDTLGFNEYAITALSGKDIGLTYTVGHDTTEVLTADKGANAVNEHVYKLTDDTIVIGFNSDDAVGVEGVALAMSNGSQWTNEYVKNAWALTNPSNDKVIVIFVDTAK